MNPLLDFDDAGAGDDEPAKGVTVGDIRAWHDEMERLQIASRPLTENEHTIARRLKMCAARREVPTWAEIDYLASALLSRNPPNS